MESELIIRVKIKSYLENSDLISRMESGIEFSLDQAVEYEVIKSYDKLSIKLDDEDIEEMT